MKRFRVISYNVQAPFLPSLEHLPPELIHSRSSLSSPRRQLFVWKTIQSVLDADKVPAFVCLQEVCSEWRESFVRDFRVCYGMEALEHNYSPPRFPMLFTMIFYRADLFDCKINSIEFTGVPQSDAQCVRLGLTSSEIEINRTKRHAVMSGTFTEKQTVAASGSSTSSFASQQDIIIGTYHAPCIFKFPHCQQLHVENALRFLSSRKQHDTDVVVLAGDFNLLPTDNAYQYAILPNSDIMDAGARQQWITSCAANFKGCIDYIFSNRTVALERFGLYGFHNFPYLCESQPSDHALLQAVYSLLPKNES